MAVTSSLIFEIEEMEVIAVERRNVKYRKKEGGSTLAIKVEVSKGSSALVIPSLSIDA